jgi:hypothetical protein
MADQSVVSKPGWRRLPIFVASTFRDMDHERDILHRIVVPTVNEQLRQAGRGASVYLVDLRWGLETDGEVDLATRQRMILELCTSEVRRCKPLFIGLLGNRYGRVVPPELARTALTDAGLTDPGFPLSATAIEMLCAAHEPGMALIFLACRTPVDDQARSVAGGAHTDLPGSAGADLLARLEDHIGRLGHTFGDYAARWHQDDRRFDCADLTDTVTTALLEVLDVALSTEHPANWVDSELSTQLWAAERETQHFVGRGEELDFISRFWSDSLTSIHMEAGNDPKNPLWRLRRQFVPTALAVTGSSGFGKSALLAKAATDLALIGPLHDSYSPVRAYVQVGLTAASERVPVCVLLLLAQFDPAARAQLQRVQERREQIDKVPPDRSGDSTTWSRSTPMHVWLLRSATRNQTTGTTAFATRTCTAGRVEQPLVCWTRNVRPWWSVSTSRTRMGIFAPPSG